MLSINPCSLVREDDGSITPGVSNSTDDPVAPGCTTRNAVCPLVHPGLEETYLATAAPFSLLIKVLFPTLGMPHTSQTHSEFEPLGVARDMSFNI